MHGPVRADGDAGPGAATLELSFEHWGTVHVAPTTVTLPVARSLGPPPTPVSPRLVRSIATAGPKDNVHGLRFSPDGRSLYAAGYTSGILQFFNAADGKELRRIDTNCRPFSFDFAALTAKGDLVASYRSVSTVTSQAAPDGGKRKRIEHDDEIRFWTVETGRERPSLALPGKRQFVGLNLSPDGRFLVVQERKPCLAGEQAEGALALWDVAAGSRRELAEGYGSSAFAPDISGLVITTEPRGDEPAVVRQIDPTTGKATATLRLPRDVAHAYRVGYLPDGKHVAVGTARGPSRPHQLLLLDRANLAQTGTLTDPEGADVSAVGFRGDFSPDGKWFAASGAHDVRLWDVVNRQVAWTYHLPAKARCFTVAFAPDGKRVALLGQEFGPNLDSEEPDDHLQPRVYLFNTAGGQPEILVCPYGWCGGLSFSPDGKTLAVGGRGAVHLFNVAGR